MWADKHWRKMLDEERRKSSALSARCAQKNETIEELSAYIASLETKEEMSRTNADVSRERCEELEKELRHWRKVAHDIDEQRRKAVAERDHFRLLYVAMCAKFKLEIEADE